MILDKLAISQISDTEYDLVDVPEWGEGAQVRIRSLFGDQRQRLNAASDTSPHWDALCCTMAIVDGQGAQIFTEADAASLAKKHPAIIYRIAREILVMSNMTKSQRDAAEKKSQETLTNSGGSSSPEPSTPATDSTSTLSSEQQAAASLNDGKPPTE